MAFWIGCPEMKQHGQVLLWAFVGQPGFEPRTPSPTCPSIRTPEE